MDQKETKNYLHLKLDDRWNLIYPKDCYIYEFRFDSDEDLLIVKIGNIKQLLNNANDHPSVHVICEIE